MLFCKVKSYHLQSRPMKGGTEVRHFPISIQPLNVLFYLSEHQTMHNSYLCFFRVYLSPVFTHLEVLDQYKQRIKHTKDIETSLKTNTVCTLVTVPKLTLRTWRPVQELLSGLMKA